MKITVGEIKKMFSEDEFDGGIEREWEGDNALQGIMIISKYVDFMKKCIITGASHDELHSVDIEMLVEQGITKEDVTELVRLNWTNDGMYLSCFV